MKSIILLILLIPSLCFADGTVLQWPAVASGGVLLVGDNSMTANTETTANDGNIYILNAASDWADPMVAVATGSANKGYARIKDYSASACKMIIASSTGSILAVSSPIDPSVFSVLTDAEFTFDGSLQITSGTGYFPGVVCNGDIYVGNEGTAWLGTYSINNYTSPTAFTPGSTSGSGIHGRPKLWITN